MILIEAIWPHKKVSIEIWNIGNIQFEIKFIQFAKQKSYWNFGMCCRWSLLLLVVSRHCGHCVLWALSVLWLLLWSPAYWTSSMWAWWQARWKAGTQLPMCPRNGSHTASQDIPSNKKLLLKYWQNWYFIFCSIQSIQGLLRSNILFIVRWKMRNQNQIYILVLWNWWWWW